MLCGMYKLSALTNLSKVQAVMSPELKKDYLASYVSISGILWLTSLSAFVVLGGIVAKLSRDEHKRRRREDVAAIARRLRNLRSGEEVMVSGASHLLAEITTISRDHVYSIANSWVLIAEIA